MSATKLEIEHSYRLELAWDLELDLQAVDIDFKALTREVPFAGRWELSVKHNDAGDLELGFEHGIKRQDGLFGQRVEVTLSFLWVDGEGKGHNIRTRTVPPGPFPKRDPSDGRIFDGCDLVLSWKHWWGTAEQSDGLFDPTSHSAYRFVATLQQDYRPVLAPKTAGKGGEVASEVAESPPWAEDGSVRLYFPSLDVEGQGAEIWTTSTFLRQASPYFDLLFSTSFAETAPIRFKRVRKSEEADASARAAGPAEEAAEDSDDETDAFLFSQQPDKHEQAAEPDEFSYYQINVVDTAYSTYKAVLDYLRTGSIAFSPLVSATLPANSTSSISRDSFLSKAYTKQPNHSLPVSPKSTYALAHLLDLPDLQKLCLEAFRSSLSPSNAATELFSDYSLRYDELRKIALEYCRSNWGFVRTSEAWKLAKQKAPRDELASSTMVELFEKLGL